MIRSRPPLKSELLLHAPQNYLTVQVWAYGDLQRTLEDYHSKVTLALGGELVAEHVAVVFLRSHEILKILSQLIFLNMSKKESSKDDVKDMCRLPGYFLQMVLSR